MAYIYLDSAKTKRVLSDQEELIQDLNSLMKQVDSVRNNLRYKIACRATISARLQDTARQIGLEAQRSAQMRDAFSQMVVLYQQTETKNLGLLQADKTTVQQGRSSKSGDNPIVEWFANGLDVVTGFLEELGEQVGNVALNTIGKVASWVLEFAVSFYNNWNEQGLEHWSARFFEEVGIEALIRIGEAALVSLGIGALVGLAAFSAPVTAVIVAVSTVAVMALGDLGINSIIASNSDSMNPPTWLEAVTDFICDQLDKLVGGSEAATAVPTHIANPALMIASAQAA